MYLIKATGTTYVCVIKNASYSPDTNTFNYSDYAQTPNIKEALNMDYPTVISILLQLREANKMIKYTLMEIK